MLERLVIENVLLIDYLELSFSDSLTVLTGETGAGKSILLDALGLALGERASPSLVRPGTAKAQVSAVFSLSSPHPVEVCLQDQEISLDEGLLILRRVISADGKSRAYVNDRPVTASLLKELSQSLIEIHGQFDRLLHCSSHRRLLDNYGGLNQEVSVVQDSYTSLMKARDDLLKARERLKKAAENRDFLTHAVDELSKFSPQEGEEEHLLKDRAYLMHRVKILENLQEACALIQGDNGAENSVGKALNLVEKANDRGDGRFQDLVEIMQRIFADMEEARAFLEEALHDDFEGQGDLETVEDRLFSLKALARKYAVSVEGLPGLLQDFQEDLARTEAGDLSLKELEEQEKEARASYQQACQELTKKRQEASKRLSEKVTLELPPLKLEKASFLVTISSLSEENWGPEGWDLVSFQVQTNKGLAPGPLSKIASGGERSRFMLALKVVLSQQGLASLVVFDEIDAGVGGAVASAIGERLARLGSQVQVLAITHSPQVASFAACHCVVSKSDVSKEGTTVTRVKKLSQSDQLEEIARMLSGEDITPEARAAAETLLARAS